MLVLLMFLQLPSPDIIVSGKRLAEEYATCHRGSCTPLRDAQVSIAFAELQFREGRYLDAKHTLSAAVARNRTHAKTAPKPVAALYEAYATVALHEGDQDTYKRAVGRQVRTLRDNLPARDPAVVTASLALGDMWIKLGNYRQADGAYRATERTALAAGEGKAAMLTTMKRAALASAMGRQAIAKRMVDELTALSEASDPVMAQVLRIVQFRVAARDADDETMKSLVQEFAPTQGATPPLLSESPYPTDGMAAANADARRFGFPDAISVRSSDSDGVEWIDAGFWIRPDGRVDEVEILRGSNSHPWAHQILAQINSRRYARFAGATDGPTPLVSSLYRVERVTRRSKYVTPKGSLINRRVADQGFETLDLTDAKTEPRRHTLPIKS
jgi:tetratricopeptide (TPR) repeat protein